MTSRPQLTELGRDRLAAHAAVLEEESLLANFKPGDDLPAWARSDKGIDLAAITRHAP